LKTIEDQIREKKAEIKEANRALSKLQDEAKRKNEPLRIMAIEMQSGNDYNDPNVRHVIGVYANKKLDYIAVRSAIESLSETPEPKSYVRWEKIPIEYSWIGRNGVGDFYMAKQKLFLDGGYLHTDSGDLRVSGFCSVPQDAILSLPYYKNSLIHRPGAKE
jgi:hypothetical protein